MSRHESDAIRRREFLKRTGWATAATVVAGRAKAVQAPRGAAGRVSIQLDPSDEIASAGPSRRAIEHLRETLLARNVSCRVIARPSEAGPEDVRVAAGGKATAFARDVALADSPEAFAIRPGKLGGHSVLLARASDVRGFVYAMTELADRAALAADPLATTFSQPVAERPANAVRGCMRMFCSDVEDKAWFEDREFWKRYLSMLVCQRFNRFNLSLGLAYDFTTEITDAYLHFAYPFLLKVPGYDVRATNLNDSERDRNLETLRFISDEAAARGLHFQLGLWTHAYEWTRSPDANHRIVGLTAQTQGPYCRDALQILLQECPNIAGVTIRTHGESGVAEGNYDLWKMVFDGIRRSGRRVEIDLHAKGLDQTMIDAALGTGLPVVVSPKFWAEHMGLPYHQAWIRPTELPQRDQGEGLFALSSGSRSFLRYGYGDLLDEKRRYGVLHRIWPGTQRLLLWGDPAFAAAYGRASGLCGSLGSELMEPLSFKGRKGSGQKGPRTGYEDPSLIPRDDFEKYLYTYRLWGRLMYDPDARPETWQRLLRQQYGAAAPAVEGALSASSRILPLVTTAHTPSAANNHWWPEMYVNMSIVDASRPQPYTDTPSPKRFGAVSPLDPQLFSSVDDFARDLAQGAVGARYTPAEVAASLTELAATAASHLSEAQSNAADRSDPSFRRFAIDTAIAIELGRFFAAKLRAGMLYALSERTGDQRALVQALDSYRGAREVWTRIVAQTKGVYMSDVSYGIAWYQRGHWADRLVAIDQDISRMQELAAAASKETAANGDHKRIDAVLAPPTRPTAQVQHVPPRSFRRGQPLAIEAATATAVEGVLLHYRHTNQAEPWRTAAMTGTTGKHAAEIPAAYTDSAFPLQYYFEARVGSPSRAVLHPGFDATWSNQPYFVVRQA